MQPLNENFKLPYQEKIEPSPTKPKIISNF